MLSMACKDALRAMIYIVKKKSDDFLSINEIAKELDLSFYFLSKILQKLVKQGLLESYRGPRGGVRLAKKPKDIKLLDVIEAIDGNAFFTECVLGFKECSDNEPCAIHSKWAKERERIHKLFANTTLHKIEKELENKLNIKL